jgi:hypothetical protein
MIVLENFLFNLDPFSITHRMILSGKRLLDFYNIERQRFTTRNPRFIKVLYKQNTEPLTSRQEAAVLLVLQDELPPDKISRMMDRMDSGNTFYSNSIIETCKPRFHLYLAKSLIKQSQYITNTNAAKKVLNNMDATDASIEHKVLRLKLLIELRDYYGVSRLMSTPDYLLLEKNHSETNMSNDLFISDDSSSMPRLDVDIYVNRTDTESEIALKGYSQQIPSVPLSILSGIPNPIDLIDIYHGSSDYEKEMISPMGFDFIMQKIASIAYLDDLNLIYRDAVDLFAKELPFRFYNQFIERLLVSQPHEISVQDVLKDMLNYFPKSGIQKASMLQSHLISPSPTTILLDEILSISNDPKDIASSPFSSPNFLISLIDRCVKLSLQKQIPYAISAVESLSPSHSTVLNHAIVVLANSGLLNHAIHYLTDLAVVRREKVSRSSFVALVSGFVMAGDLELAQSCVNGMAEEKYEAVKTDEWKARIRTSVDVMAVRGFLDRVGYYRVLMGIMDEERVELLDGVEEELRRGLDEVEIEMRGSCRIGVHVVMDRWDWYSKAEKRDWRGVIREGRVCCGKVGAFLKSRGI